MSSQKYLHYRGSIKAAIGIDDVLFFVTTHPEKQPTSIYRLSTDRFELKEDALPCGATSLVHDQEQIWFTGTDGHLYQYSSKGGAPKTLGKAFASVPTAMTTLSNERLAILEKSHAHIVNRKNGKLLQSLELPDNGASLAADPSGNWLAVGTSKGRVLVFESEEQPEFNLSGSGQLHEGAVSALLFENEELRFFSAGTDQKLLSTHARGTLEPEDRGRGNSHSDRVTSMLWGPNNRFFTGGSDKTVKSWPWPGNARPATLKDGIIKVVDLALVQLNRKPHLAIFCTDASIRIFALDEEGRFGDLVVRCNGATATMKHELQKDEPARREDALRTLAKYNDSRSIELISDQVGADPDRALSRLAVKLLADSDHSRAPKLLEKWIGHGDEKVRATAFHGLRRHLGEGSLHPMELALATNHVDIGKLAVEALQPLASKDDRALDRLVTVLNANAQEVRLHALMSLEKVYADDSPEANLIGLQSNHADVRRRALERLYQRKLLGQSQVQAVLRWRTEDEDAEVRRTAFLIMLHTREKLVPRLRQLDPELDRQLIELESIGKPKKGKEKPTVEEDVSRQMEAVAELSKKAEKFRSELDDTDYDPLLQATASRSLSTCLRGARGLALLGSSRALGLLLQLSREENAPARVEVCKALAALDDPRSVNRLHSLLYDSDPAVRDAAFSALDHLYADEPVKTAEAGLSASSDDVRRRGLQVLTSLVRKKKPKGPEEPTWELLLRALNDSFPSVRSEAFKAVLNLKIDGGGAKTLRFVLQSVQPDVRLEVLTEVMAQMKEPWAWELLLSFYNDPDANLRSEAFEFAKKQAKDLEALEPTLESKYVDLRKMGVDALIKKHSAPAQSLLVKALTDEEREVRKMALDALILDDARPALLEALQSEHGDVRSGAGVALAKHGEPAAYDSLVELASAPEPEKDEDRKRWQSLVEIALSGLAWLGDTRAHSLALSLTQCEHKSIRDKAVRVLIWTTRPETQTALKPLLQHSDLNVRYHAAFALAILGDPLVSSMVFSAEASNVLYPIQRLVAALCLGSAGEDQLSVFLDDSNAEVRSFALILFLLLELKDPGATPDRCLTALASRMPRVRLTAARALELYADREAFFNFIVQHINDKGEDKPWTINAKTVDALSELIVHGDPHLRARTAFLLQHLTEREQKKWNQPWGTHRRRYAEEIKSLLAQAKKRETPKLSHSEKDLQQLAFGAYVGLVREQGGSRGQGRHNVPWQQIIRVRQTALRRIHALAEDAGFAGAAKPVFIQALGDPNQAVRSQAFEHLQSLGMSNIELGAEALEAGHLDLGVKGLELLTDGTSVKEGQAVLEQVMMTRKDQLAIEAAKLVMEQQGRTSGATRCLEAAHEPLRIQAVRWLTEEYEKDSEAQKQLRNAVKSRYQTVRQAAAFRLADKKDPTAFEALNSLLLDEDEEYRQSAIIQAMVSLEDQRGPTALLDRIENDPRGTAAIGDLFRGAGRFRRVDCADRILKMMNSNNRWASPGVDALLCISGYDQPLEDPDDEREDRKWLEKQHPRNDTVLSHVLQFCLDQGATNRTSGLIPQARWAAGKEVEPVLITLTTHSEDALRERAVEALGFRARKRNGPIEPLLQALNHKEPQTQFVAAEALARAGRAEGIQILLSSIEMMSDDRLRARAVQALGILGDERCMDVLLKLANDNEHPLQREAAEAIGHLGRSEKKDEILRLLSRLALQRNYVGARALVGLRWLNVPEGWKLIRKRAKDEDYYALEAVIPLLGYNDEPETRELVLELIRESEYDGLVESARRLFGPDSLEPDYALLESKDRYFEYDEEQKEALKRVSEKGESARMFEILGKGPSAEIQQELCNQLLICSPLPIEEAMHALESNNAQVVLVASRILGRAGQQAKSAANRVESAVQTWRQKWEVRRARMLKGGGDESELYDEGACLESLAWACGRVGDSHEELLRLLTAHSDDSLFRPIRLAALTALSSGSLPKKAHAILESLVTDNDAEMRALAADLLGRSNPKRAKEMATRLLSDRASFNRMIANDGVDAQEPLRSAANQIHYQGVALPHLIAEADLDGLTTVMRDGKLPEETRLGAIEALARMADEQAEEKLVEMGKAESEDVELRKAAWRGLRRSKRARQKQS